MAKRVVKKVQKKAPARKKVDGALAAVLAELQTFKVDVNRGFQDLGQQLGSVRTEVQAVHGEVRAMREDLSEVKRFVSELAEKVGHESERHDGRIDEALRTLEELRARVDALEAKAA